MIRLALKLAAAGAALWALWTYVPVHGRTLAERWRAAGSVTAFLDRARLEIVGRAPPAGPQARRHPGDAPERPSESVSDKDRAAVDRLLSDRLSRGR